MKYLGSITVRPKGEVTIPKEIRTKTKIITGDHLAIFFKEGELIIKKEKRKTSYEQFEL